MKEPGLAMIKLAKKSGTWDALTEVDNMVIPSDLTRAFAECKAARMNWDAFSRSSKKAILEWILNAKKTETRQNRINQTVKLAEQNIKANLQLKK